MTPSTPPRSRSMMTEEPIHDNFSLSQHNPMARKPTMPPATPQKNTGSDVPVTPSTIMHMNNRDDHDNNLLFKPGQQSLLAPPPQIAKFNGLKSPEFSPMRRLSIPNNSLMSKPTTSSLSNNIEKANVSRVLFPTSFQSDDDDEDNFQVEEEDEDRLLPPSTPPRSKHAKTTPGTPSHKIITTEQAKMWHNESHPSFLSSDDEDDDENVIISRKPMANPFMASSKPLTKEERHERHQKLVRENPDIENVVTYVNKQGEIVKQRTLTNKQRNRFQPRSLFNCEDSD